MKKILFVVLSFISLSAAAQSFRLNAYTNYVFNDQVDSYYEGGRYWAGTIKGGFQWGAGAEFMVSPFNGVELTYYRQATSAPVEYVNSIAEGLRRDNFDVNLNWIMLNGVRHIRKPGGKFEGFGSLGAGVAIINTQNQRNGNEGDATKFAWQLRGGGTFWASERVGIRINAQLQSAVQAIGGGFTIGTGGVGAGISSFSSLMQFGLGGGLVFKFDGAAKK